MELGLVVALADKETVPYLEGVNIFI